MHSYYNSIFKVFETVIEKPEICREDLSNLTGFSRVTVGKAVDELASYGVLIEKKEASDKVGRRREICYPNNEKAILVYDLCEKLLYIFNISAELLGTHKIENLDEMLIVGFEALTKYDGIEPIGFSFVVPELEYEEYKDKINTVLSGNADLIIGNGLAAVYSMADSVKDDKTTVLANLNSNKALFGTIYSGELINSKNKTVKWGFSGTIEDFACNILGGVMLLKPEQILLFGDKNICENIKSTLEEKINEKLKDGFSDISVNYSKKTVSASLGAAIVLRKNYILKMLEKR